MDNTDDFVYNNEDESDMGALHGAVHVHLNAIAAVRRNIATGPSALFCVDCNEEIPEPRRIAVQGCKRCLGCQQGLEDKR